MIRIIEKHDYAKTIAGLSVFRGSKYVEAG